MLCGRKRAPQTYARVLQVARHRTRGPNTYNKIKLDVANTRPSYVKVDQNGYASVARLAERMLAH